MSEVGAQVEQGEPPDAIDLPAHCQCQAAGFCARHNRTVDAHQLQLCTTNAAGYRDYWDRRTAAGGEDEPCCDAVNSETADLPKPNKPAAPTLAAKAATYLSERARWIAAGRPRRSAELVEKIYTTICMPCEYFVPSGDPAERGQCGACGCKLKRRGNAVNKISWATTSCPKGRWLAGDTITAGIITVPAGPPRDG